jgi:hypothetical protein
MIDFVKEVSFIISMKKAKNLNQKIILYVFYFGYEGATGQPTDSRAGPWPEKISRVEIVMPSVLTVRKHIGTV